MRTTLWSNWLLAILLIATAPILANTHLDRPAFTILSKTNGYIEIQFDLPDYELIQQNHAGTSYQKIDMQNATYPSESGMPELPVISTMIAIPDLGKASVEFVSSSTELITGFTPSPVQEEGSDKDAFFFNPDYYNGRKSIASEVLSFSKPQIMRDMRVILVQVQPFLWDANSHELVINKQINFRVNLSDEPGVNEFVGSRAISPSFDKIYNAQILNYQDYRNGLTLNTPDKIVVLYGEYSDPVFLSLINNYALWKRQKGADVQLVSTAVAGTSNTAVKTYLQGLYDDPQTRFDFLVIIGDITGPFAVPAWNSEGIGDYPYQMLAGDDLLGDVFIGRISAENTSQLDVILSKTYAYERNININNSDRLNRMLLTSDTLYDGISVVNLSHYIREISQYENPDYTYTVLNQNSPSPSAMNYALNQGVGFFNYRGYAGMSGWSVNDSNLYSINQLCHAVIITCNTGNYDATATTEQFIRIGSAAAPKGAVTAIGMWGGGTATMPNNALCGGVFAAIYPEGMRTMGEALLYSKLNFSRLYAISNPTISSTFNQWCNLMGDPTMEVFISIPHTFTSNAPESLVSGANNLDLIVKDQDGFPIPNACVTLTNIQNSNAAIISRGFTDEAGRVYLPFSIQLAEGTVVLTISKHDFKPLQQTISIATGSLLAGSPMIDDDLQGESSGNGNGIANAGETLEALFSLRNTSSNLINGITGFIRCNNPLVTLADTLLTFPDIASGTSAYCLAPVLVQISSAITNQTLLKFSLHLTDAEQNEYEVSDFLSVTDAELRFESCQIVGGGDSVLDPGETSLLNVTIKNIGSLAVTDLVGELFTLNDLVEVRDSLGAFGSVEVNGLSTNQSDNYILFGRDVLIPGMVIPLRLRLSNLAGFLQWLDFSITIGTVTVNDPLGPDNYGYLIYDDTDTAYESCPVYDWIGIAPAEGGTGTALSINDPEAPGEGDGLSATSLSTVDLPFSFKFYGQDYQEITVCSNGFIVFGETDNGEFRNYRLPGPMGPSPMIAAFWDDLATGPESGIYTWYDNTNHAFLIEWYQMLSGFDNSFQETFQIILYDPAYHSTSYGVGPIKIQYHTFNNVNSATSNQNNGNFCSIGIENTDQSDGLEYSFMNTYPVAASPLGNGRAIVITTQPVYYHLAYLVPETVVINDQNNNVVEPGESIELGVMLHNLGDLPASGINAVISCQDPLVTIVSSTSAYHPISGHGYEINQNAFQFTVSPTCPANHSLMFTILISTPGGDWTHSFNIEVQKAGINFESFFINDFEGNNNGYADPDESFLLVLNVRNPSQLTALNLVGQLSSTNTNIVFTNPILELPSIEGNSISQFVFEVYLNPSTPQNTTIPLSFTVTSANTPPITVELGLGCGAVGMSENFEDNNGEFTHQNGWAWGTPNQTQAHSGSKLWATVLTDQYTNGANYYLVSQPVSIGTSAELSFWHKLFCQNNFDGGNVSVSVNGGGSWITISPSSGGSYVNSIYSMNEPGFSGTIGTWTLVKFDLTSYANSEILIRWHFTSDGSVTGYGWFIDDVMVSGFAVRSGVVSGVVTLPEGGNPSLATVATSYLDTSIIASPSSSGDYSLYVPMGSYSFTASMPYHISATSPGFIITNSSLDYVHDFILDYLPPVNGISLYHEPQVPAVILNWNPPVDPVYPVLEYKVYRKTGPGLNEVVGSVTETSFSEDIIFAGHYYYFVRPVYALGEGAPSDTLELVITNPSDNDDPLPGVENTLYANFPNPFNPSTTIPLDIAKGGTAQLDIYNIRGQLIKTLVTGKLAAGRHMIPWNGLDQSGRPVASGVYFYRLETDGFEKTKKMMLVK
jgi:hypothetical protein